MGTIMFFALVFIFALIVLPIWALARTFRIEEEQKVKIGGLEVKIRRLEESLEGGKIRKPLKLEIEEEKEEKPIVSEKKAAPIPVAAKSARVEETNLPLKTKTVSEPKPEPKPIRPPAPPKPSEWEKKWNQFIQNVDWEQFTGVKLFAWLGGLALFCGAAFFVKYSIDRNLIPPALRLAVGALTGLALIIWSLRINRSKYSTTSHILAAGGVGVLYTVVFAAAHMYHYIPNLVGLILLALVSVSAFVLALFLEGVSISTLGALGAYGAPLLLSTGHADLPALFVYLAVVNAGIFEVVRRLKTPGLFLLSVVGTLFLLSLGSLGQNPPVGSEVTTLVALANLALFSFFLYRMPTPISNSQSVRAGGFALFGGSILLGLVLLGQPGFYPLLLVTVGSALALFLAYGREEWAGAVIPYNVATFLVAVFWVMTRFDAKGPVWDFLLFLLYGLVGGLGPILLVRKHGLKDLFLHWFKVFPAVSLLMTLMLLFRGPETSLWFWPMVLGLHLIGMLLCFLVGGFLELAALAVLTLVNGFCWIIRSPSLVLDLGFYIFLLGAGVLLCVAAMTVFKYLPNWLSSPLLKPFEGEAKKLDEVKAEWMAAFPALGAFVLLGTAFLVQNPVQPIPGMVTGLCFLGVALFLGKRISSAPLVITALFAAGLAQSCWMLKVLPGQPLNEELLYWSGGLWLGSLLVPFLFFGPAEKQKRIWQAWAIFEVVQACYFLKAADSLWPRDIMGWIPLGLFLIKVPAVKNLLDRLESKAERNGILAFHGGVLLFYLSCLPVLLLDDGWMGLTLVFEAMALLWLNRRIEHPGLPWVAVLMAPAGLAFLLSHLHLLKQAGAPPILNWAVASVALAVAALWFASHLAPEVQSGNVKAPKLAPPIPFKDYFLWLAIGMGFFLLNLLVADWFGGEGATGLSFQLFSRSDLTRFISYSLLWSLFGAVLWRAGALPRSLRLVGILLFAAGWLRVVVMPYLFQPAVALMKPFLNLPMLAYLGLVAILVFLIKREGEEKDWNLKPFFIGLLAILGLIALSQEGSVFFQQGQPFSFFFRHNFSMALASGLGWTFYGLALYLWPSKLERSFRIAGVVLASVGLLKMLAFPSRYAGEFGNLTPILNMPNLVFALILGALLYLNLKDQKDLWPFEKPSARFFWGASIGLFSFFVLNVEVVQLFGEQGHPFTFETFGRFSQQLAYSLGWLLFAMGLLWVGIKWASVMVRWAALGLFFITTLKIFFGDLWHLGQLYRVASFVGLAAVLILVSFLYQRFLATGGKK